MSKKEQAKRVRKIGEREELIEEHLGDYEIQEIQDTVMALLDQRTEIEEKKKEQNANFKAQLETVELQLETNRRLFRSKIRKSSLMVEEYLTSANEVIRVRKDTQEQLGRRTATPAELQEEMFADEPEPEVQQEAPPDETGQHANVSAGDADNGQSFGDFDTSES